MNNFSFFTGEWEILSKIGESAERNVYIDPNTTLSKLRLLAETIAKAVIASENIEEDPQESQFARLQLINKENIAENEVLDFFHFIRKRGNKAVHKASYGTTDEALKTLYIAYQLSTWFMEVYVDWQFDAPSYGEPIEEKDSIELKEKINHLQEEIEQKEKSYENRLRLIKTKPVDDDIKLRRKEKSNKFIRKHRLNESETRVLIDEKLREAGWIVDTEKFNYKKHKTIPEKNKSMAIAEWPIDNLRVDYALFIGYKLVGVIEAKAKHLDVPGVLDGQSKKYARKAQQFGNVELILDGKYKVPFVYATNGRQYLRQIAEKSGVWFWDARQPNKHAHAIETWHSPEDLELKLTSDTTKADDSLRNYDIDKFDLRYYQQDAILAIEEAIINDQRKMLVAMATGTGKTRTAIALMYRLIETKKVRRILFLVDRNSLGKQTYDAMQDNKMREGLTFNEIYDVQGLESIVPELETRVHIATVQGMVRRLFYNEEESSLSVGQYDFIVVDEAHRGYINDKEMTDDELLFRNQSEYVSQYRRVIDYFDAMVLGLTATPALHTTEIFGSPIFQYTYSEAVIDGFLVDHEPPYLIETKLNQNGIEFKKGDPVEIYDADEEEISLEEVEDDISFVVEKFNKAVYTESFNKTVLGALADYIDIESDEKTLIFTSTNTHADSVVRLLKKAFEDRGDIISDDAIVKITGATYDVDDKISRFKNEKMPNVVVTVDLLTTGIDVPKITNLVFLRPVKSRILYEQMLGRGTRLAPEIGKDRFRIFDAVGIYEKLQKYTEMKPVVKSPHISIKDLMDAYIDSETKDEGNHFLEQLVAKVQSKKQRIDEEGKEKFEQLTGGQTIDQFTYDLKDYSQKDVMDKQTIFEYIEEYKPRRKGPYISKHRDEVIDIKRGYGEGNTRPEDYLKGFEEFIRNNMNEIPALQIITQRPKDLTKDDLRQVVNILETKGYKQTDLQDAWRNAKQENIAAHVISFIRQAALGEALVDEETRIKNAMKKVYVLHNWTPRQKNWLQRIEKQLLKFPVLAPKAEAAFVEDPFRSSGGYKKLKKELGEEELDEIVDTINRELYIS